MCLLALGNQQWFPIMMAQWPHQMTQLQAQDQTVLSQLLSQDRALPNHQGM